MHLQRVRRQLNYPRFFFRVYRVNWEESVGEIEKQSFDDIASGNGSTPTGTRSTDSIQEEREQYLIVYAIILIVGTILYIGRSVSYFKMCLRISINMHDMLFRGISRVRMIFFNRNPSGRILNRFARDINNIDSLLPGVLYDSVDVSVVYRFFVVRISGDF